MIGSKRKHDLGGGCTECGGNVGPCPHTRKPRRYREAGHQARLVAWARELREPVLRTEVGGKKTDKQRIRDYEMGTEKGTPDLFFPRLWAWVEMKDTAGHLSREQRAVHDMLRKCGYRVLVAYGYDDAQQQLAGLIQMADAKSKRTLQPD